MEAGSAAFDVFCHLTELVERGEAVVNEEDGQFRFAGPGRP
jgi:hypothetical protein